MNEWKLKDSPSLQIFDQQYFPRKLSSFFGYELDYIEVQPMQDIFDKVLYNKLSTGSLEMKISACKDNSGNFYIPAEQPKFLKSIISRRYD